MWARRKEFHDFTGEMRYSLFYRFWDTTFIETVYLPMAKAFLRPSTYKNYKTDEYERHFKHRLGNLRLREFRTAHGQRLLSAISKDNPELGHKTLLRLKSFLSGVFRHAKAEGY